MSWFHALPQAAPRGIVLMASARAPVAGPGRAELPAALQPLPDGCMPIDAALDALQAHAAGEIVVVTGHGAAALAAHLRRRADAPATVHHARWDGDGGIAAADTGVAALQHPERGYVIVDAALPVPARAWAALMAAMACGPQSLWAALGGAACRPAAPFDGPGLLAVGPGQVPADRLLRRKLMASGLGFGPAVPWARNPRLLPCRLLTIEHALRAGADAPSARPERAPADLSAA